MWYMRKKGSSKGGAGDREVLPEFQGIVTNRIAWGMGRPQIDLSKMCKQGFSQALFSAGQQLTAGMVIAPKMPCKRLCAVDDIGPAALPHRNAGAGVPEPAAPVSQGCPRLPGTYRASSFHKCANLQSCGHCIAAAQGSFSSPFRMQRSAAAKVQTYRAKSHCKATSRQQSEFAGRPPHLMGQNAACSPLQALTS